MPEHYTFPADRGIVPLRDLTLSYVHHVLIACSGNKSEAARRLAISRRRLYHWLDAARRAAARRPLPLRKPAEVEIDAETDLHAIFALDRWLTAPPLSETAYRAIQGWFCASHVASKLGSRDAADISLRLAAHVVANHPTSRLAGCAQHALRSRVLGWTAHVERLHTVDGLAWDDIRRVALWSQHDARWRCRVLGGEALRLHWDAVVTDMAQEQR